MIFRCATITTISVRTFSSPKRKTTVLIISRHSPSPPKSYDPKQPLIYFLSDSGYFI